MVVNWTELLLGIIGALNVGLIIKMLSVLQTFHKKEISAISASSNVAEREVSLLRTQIELQKQNYEQKISIKGHYLEIK